MAKRSLTRKVGGTRGGRRRGQPFYPGARSTASPTEIVRAVMREYSTPAFNVVRTSGGSGNRDGGTGTAGLVQLEQFYTGATEGQCGVASGDVPDGARTEFELDYEPLNGMVAIFINGRHRPEVDYSVSAATITFDTAPRSDMFISGFYLR